MNALIEDIRKSYIISSNSERDACSGRFQATDLCWLARTIVARCKEVLCYGSGAGYESKGTERAGGDQFGTICLARPVAATVIQVGREPFT
jgi:hypothetical protein